MQAQAETSAGARNHTVLTARHTTEKAGFSIATLWRKVAAKEFPQPIQLGPNRVGWIESEVDAWIDARIAERDQRGAA
jgi:prophage regulatory protein